jgi:EpsI family protein
VALVLALAGIAAYYLGWAALRAMLFPFAFLLFMAPWPDLLVERISFPMQLMTSTYAAMFAGLLGLPVRADGVNLYLPERDVSIAVAAACSGMRSLVALMAVASLFAYLLPGSLPRRWLLFAAGVPLALTANVVRVLLILLVGAHYGQDAAMRFHDQSGPVLFGLCSLGLLGLSRVLSTRRDLTPGRRREPPSPPGPLSQSWERGSLSEPAFSPLPGLGEGRGVRAGLQPDGVRGIRPLLVPCALLALAGVAVRLVAEDAPGRVVSTPMRLGSVATVAGSWRSIGERPLDAEALRLLAPDATLWRTYRRAGGADVGTPRRRRYADPGVASAPGSAASRGEVDLMVVYGHRKQTFHSPAFCMPGAGYQIITKRQTRLRIPGVAEALPINAMTVQKGNRRLLVCYWYVHGGEATTGLARHTAGLLWRRLRRQPASGALIRLMTPVGDAEGPALDTISDFVAAIYPGLREKLEA